LKSWNTSPTLRRLSSARAWRESRAVSAPLITTLPELATSSPPARLSSVDLPDPDGPMIATSSVARTARLTWRRAGTAKSPLP
jgi:hypothetical protein